jgi:hypothetical protein
LPFPRGWLWGKKGRGGKGETDTDILPQEPPGQPRKRARTRGGVKARENGTAGPKGGGGRKDGGGHKGGGGGGGFGKGGGGIAA